MSKEEKNMEKQIVEHLWALYLLQKEMEKNFGACTEGFSLTVQDDNISVKLDFSSSIGVPTKLDNEDAEE